MQYSSDGELLTLAVKLAPSADGYVITFEDITRQLLDQRQAAWSDVARRIAHEIKNPLTPIQLATERLKRRYRKQIETDGELFEELTGTIIRQVGALRKMVDEFSLRPPSPAPQAGVPGPRSRSNSSGRRCSCRRWRIRRVRYSFACDKDIGAILCDRHQLGQAMTNVLKNAAEAIEAQERAAGEADGDVGEPYRGQVEVTLEADNGHVAVTVSDNGIGLPMGGDRIMEPYVTTREKGTGSGPRHREEDRGRTWRRPGLRARSRWGGARHHALRPRSRRAAGEQRGRRMTTMPFIQEYRRWR